MAAMPCENSVLRLFFWGGGWHPAAGMIRADPWDGGGGWRDHFRDPGKMMENGIGFKLVSKTLQC